MSLEASANAQYPPILITDKTQADGNVEVNANSGSDKFLITVIPALSATGKISLSVRPHKTADFEPILDPKTDVQQVIDFSDDSKTIIVMDYVANGFRIEPSNVVGSYSVVIQQGTS